MRKQNILDLLCDDLINQHEQEQNNLNNCVDEKSIDKNVKLYIENEDNPDNIQIIYCKCPSCNYTFGEDEVERQIGYCPECGQSLNWTEYDERKIDEEMEDEKMEF